MKFSEWFDQKVLGIRPPVQPKQRRTLKVKNMSFDASSDDGVTWTHHEGIEGVKYLLSSMGLHHTTESP